MMAPTGGHKPGPYEPVTVVQWCADCRAEQDRAFNQLGKAARQFASVDTTKAVADQNYLASIGMEGALQRARQPLDRLARAVHVHPNPGEENAMPYPTQAHRQRGKARVPGHESWD